MRASGFFAGDDWSLAFPAHEGVKCYAVAAGQCWLLVEGADAGPIHLTTGECFFTTRGLPFRLASDLSLESLHAPTVLAKARHGGVVSLDSKQSFSIVGGHFKLEGNHAETLLDLLPAVVRVRDQTNRARLCWCLDRMTEELRLREPGSDLIIQHLAHMMLVEALRLFISDGIRTEAGWLSALADRQISLAISLMHDKPSHRWTLAELGAAVGMSRSSFALRFKEKVGQSPMEYLTRWRMLIAADQLRTTARMVASIALSLGYDSESSFSTAFKRVMGCTPRQYGRDGLDTRGYAALAPNEHGGLPGRIAVPSNDWHGQIAARG